MKIVDLSHKFNINDDVFPGTDRMNCIRTHKVPTEGYNLTLVTVNSHAGTHTDAPLHFIDNGTSLGEVNIEKYVGKCFVVDCHQNGEPNAFIELEDVVPYEEQIKKAGKVIFYTGWDKQFGKDNFFTEYPGLTEELTEYLVGLGVDMVGVEGPSLSTVKGTEVHHILLEKGVAVVESLANLESLAGKEILFCGAPIAFEEMDGFPIRAYAIEL